MICNNAPRAYGIAPGNVIGETDMKYLISYDLTKPEKDYAPLYKALSDIEATKVLMAQWVANCNDTNAVRLRDNFWQFMDPNDRLLIVSLENNDWAARNLLVKISSL